MTEIRLLLAGLVLAAVAWFGWSYQRRGAEIERLEVQHALDQAALEPLREANADYARTAKERKEQRDRELEDQRRIAQEAQAQATQARAQARQAEARADAWRRGWRDRPASCAAALAALDAACPALRDY